jgi:hypothetical protein
MRYLIFLLVLLGFAVNSEAQTYIKNRVIPLYDNGKTLESPTVDASTNATVTIEYEHHEVHEGDHFYTKSIATVASGATVAYLMALPSTTKTAHLTWSGTGSAITGVVMIEGVANSLKGTVQTIFNNDRNSSSVSGATFYNTVTGGPWTGTTIYRIASGSATQQSRTPATSERGQELILKSGVTYAFLFTSGTNDNLTNLVCGWYEHTPKH